MQRSLFGVLIGSILVIGATAYHGFSEPVAVAAHQGTTAGLLPKIQTHVTAVDGYPPVVTVVDTERRVMAVYHIDLATGKIALRSVRDITWDLQMPEYNTEKPLPQEIRSMQRSIQQ